MTLDNFLFCFNHSNISINNPQLSQEIYNKINQYEEEFFSKAGIELTRLYNDFKYALTFKRNFINYNDFEKILYFGIKVGIKFKNEFEKS